MSFFSSNDLGLVFSAPFGSTEPFGLELKVDRAATGRQSLQKINRFFKDDKHCRLLQSYIFSIILDF
jgi:hypothetical protein